VAQSQVSPLKRVYTFDEAQTATTFSRPTWYRWERQGHLALVRMAGKTFVPADVIERLLSGELKLPSGHRAKHLHQPKAKPPRRKRGRPPKQPEQSPPTLAE
jgi:hypothetical protein